MSKPIPTPIPTPKDGASAFPERGISLRDYLAAKAMQSALIPDTTGSEWRSDEHMAAWAYAMADTMLRQRRKKP